MELDLMQLYEQERLLEVRALDILDSAPEAAFDKITQLTAQLCAAPIALISFIDEKRQWIKAKTGLEQVELVRQGSFCSSTIMEEGIFMLEDASAHELFRHNELVNGPMKIKFYAGYPLKSVEGYSVGTLSVLDTHKRTLSQDQQLTLQLLAAQVVQELKFRQTHKQLTTVQHQLQLMESRLLAADDTLAASESDSTTRQDRVDFIAALAHEIQQPLEYVVEHIEIVLQENQLEPGAKNILRSIQSFLQKTQATARNVFELNAMEAGKLKLNKSRFLLKDTLKQLHRSLLARATEKDLRFELDINLSVPDEVRGDGARLQQILFNALDNAFMFTDQGSVRLAVDVVYQSDIDWVLEFMITDTGAGMSLEQQGVDCENFQLGNATGSQYGLGLATTRKLIEMQGGQLSITSTRNKGSVLAFHLRYEEPLGRPSVAEE
ncbi:sensor histidine kinase [Hymenobacter defluvii]|uniref:histidine kinase n=1 Tax=Hymenobacter defluvii TaxID=2054411 RepID=A0ABS3TIF9_9BACT|nr:GAF domain-containing protein [Hymenobacter defluvii]MBO3273444.1 GAF domain-containing protein [Hymenobacter defluvii]